MFSKIKKGLITAAALALGMCFSAFADVKDFPYEVEFDLDQCPRLCYAGHEDSVEYEEGLAITPEAMFWVTGGEGDNPADDDGIIDDLSVTISLLYENEDHSGSFRETVKKYDFGDLEYDEAYGVLSGNIIENLEGRGRLYSDTLTGMVMTLSSSDPKTGSKEIYLYVCDDDDYYDYLMAAPEDYEYGG